MSHVTITPSVRGWTPEGFKAFWNRVDPKALAALPAMLTDDIVGHWPRPLGTVRGVAPYVRIIEAIFAICPDFSLAVPEHASSGEFHFVRWVATGTGPDGAFEFHGCDRVRLRDGRVCENYIFSDAPFFALVARACAV
jgi:hypothetical protein